MSSLLNSRGYSLLELMVAAAIVGISLWIGSSQFLLADRTSNRVKRQAVLSGLLILEGTALEGWPFEDLPAAGSCFERTYDAKGEFVSEASRSFADCQGTGLASGSLYKIFWTIEDESSVAATFTNSQFMKLASTSNGLKKLTLKGVYLDLATKLEKVSQYVIFVGQK